MLATSAYPDTLARASRPAEGLELGFAPFQLSGVVYGSLLNHRPALEAQGDAAHAAPYKAAPLAPVLYLKPRNTLNHHGAVIDLPVGVDALEVAASLAIVIGRTACRVPAEQAPAYVAGYTLACDLSVPHAVYYRPSIRQKALDGSCPVGPVVVPAGQIARPDALNLQVWVDDALRQDTDTAERVRGVARLLADVTEFMTLQPGDLLLLGPSHAAPLARAGQRVRVALQGVGELAFSLRSKAGAA